MTERLVDINLIVKVAVANSIGILNLEGDGVSRGLLTSGIDGGTGARTNLLQYGEIGIGPLFDTKIGKSAVCVVSYSIFAEGIEGNLLLSLNCERIDVGTRADVGWGWCVGETCTCSTDALLKENRALEGTFLRDYCPCRCI